MGALMPGLHLEEFCLNHRLHLLHRRAKSVFNFLGEYRQIHSLRPCFIFNDYNELNIPTACHRRTKAIELGIDLEA